ncbi:MAG TPA: AAA family ATPase [Actinomycetota bacterium]|nr:AAA family ATPase [Actinomycetota bacterium]
MTDAGIVTLLFTDLSGSTQLFDELGDEQADALRRAHFRVLREAVAARGGQEVKNLGDGLMVVFPSAVDAVGCAVEMQQAMKDQNADGRPVEVRVGLHVGEPIRDEDDYFGRSVIVARRLCEQAQGSQILASGLVKDLVGARGLYSFVNVGALELKGLNEPLQAYEVGWQPTEDEAIPLPGVLSVTEAAGFVGRAEDVDQLVAAWKKSLTRERQVVLLAGEPGIGKTRLAAEVARQCRADGGTVLYGRCDEETIVPYQPFVEALTHFVAHAPAHRLRQLTRASGPQLKRLVPELAERLPQLPDPDGADPETERFRLFEATASFLAGVTAAAPTVLVLDDLHWADKPTLQLLQHVVRRLEDASLLIVGTYRDVDLDRKHPLADVLASMRRDHLYERISLGGLSRDEVTELLEQAAGHSMDERGEALAEALYRETEGNPFFIEEVLRHLIETRRLYLKDGRWVSDVADVSELGIPEGVREAIGRRLSRLAESVNEVLSHASTLGRGFEFPVVAQMVTVDEDELMTALESALKAQLIVESPGHVPTYAFKHALVRQTLYDELSLPRKQKLHARAAAAIEKVHSNELDEWVPALATHYALAGVAVDQKKTLSYLSLAAQQAAALFAWEEAVEHLQAALEISDDAGSSKAEKARLLQSLGDLMYVAGFDWSKGISYLESALALYEELGEEYRAAQIHSRLGTNLVTNPDMLDVNKAREHFDKARSVLEAKETVALAYVYSGLGAIGLWTLSDPESSELARRGMEIGEKFGNVGAWAGAAAIRAWHLFAEGRVPEAIALAEDAWERADAQNHRAGAFLATWLGGSLKAWHGQPADCLAWCERELASPRVTQAPTQRRILEGCRGIAFWVLGRLEDMRRVLPEGPDSFFLAPILDIGDGKWEAAAADLKRRKERDQRTNNSWFATMLGFWEGTALRMLSDFQPAEEVLNETVATGRSAPQIVSEIQALEQLGLLLTETDRVNEWASRFTRLEKLLSDADWGGHEGVLRFWRATFASLEGDRVADEEFLTAVEILRRYGMRWQLAEGYACWAWALLKAGRGDDSEEKVSEADAVYDEIGADDRWKTRLREFVNSARA